MIYQKEISSYDDLEKYIRQQLCIQTVGGKRKIKIALSEVWFYKLHKLISFSLKYQMSEQELELPQKEKKYWVEINGVKALIEKYDIQRQEDMQVS